MGIGETEAEEGWVCGGSGRVGERRGVCGRPEREAINCSLVWPVSP